MKQSEINGIFALIQLPSCHIVVPRHNIKTSHLPQVSSSHGDIVKMYQHEGL